MAVAEQRMRLSNSKVKTWRRCPKKYKYKYVDKLQPKTKSLPLERGTWLHSMLQYHYDGMGWKTVWKRLARDFNNLFEEEREMLGDLPGETKRIMQSYLRHWQLEDQGITVVDSELDEIVTLPNGIDFNFIIDLIVEDDDGGLWLWDHKTVKDFMDADFHLLDAQLTRYYWCAEHMGYTPLRGVVFNELRTKPPTIPQLLVRGGLSVAKSIDTDLYTYYREIRRHDLDPADYSEILQRLAAQNDKWFRRTRIPKDPPVTKALMEELVYSAREIRRAERRGEFPRTPEKSCKWDCEFKDLCVTELHGGNVNPIIKMNFTERRRREELK